MDYSALPHSTFAPTSLSGNPMNAVSFAAARAPIIPLAQLLPKFQMPELKLKRHSPLADLVFGSAAGFTSKLVEHPFDTIKGS